MFRKNPVLLSLFVLLCACNTQKDLISFHDYFIIGSGGGVTGLYEEYKIHKSGDVYNYNFDEKEFEFYSKMPAKNRNSFFKLLNEIDFNKNKFEKPGNYNYYLQEGDGAQKIRILWNDQDLINNPKILGFYDAIDNWIRNNKKVD
jgi:hypothetical protein